MAQHIVRETQQITTKHTVEVDAGEVFFLLQQAVPALKGVQLNSSVSITVGDQELWGDNKLEVTWITTRMVVNGEEA